ncbi:MAG: AmmeMemoRadiSam system protein B [Proteobacteria bacterium]|nr:AmmeMemoRadiSam system protein B [Pseudomonadota bacterium]
MKQRIKAYILCFAVCFLVFFIRVDSINAENIRKPVYAGSFYPAGKPELNNEIGELTAKAKRTSIRIPANKSLKALILPHAGYVYSGYTASHASLVLSENQFSKVILMGPDHRIGFSNCALTDADSYQTPIGKVKIHKDAAKLRLQPDLFRSIPASDSNEHSLEVVLPFMQTYLKKFEVIPIIIGSGDYSKFANAIEPLIDENTLLVASSDLSHYLSYDEAVKKDRETINAILNLEKEKLSKRENSACGKMPILIVMSLAGKYNWKPVLIHYSNSGDTAGERSRVVGYTAVAFYGDSSMENQTVSNKLTPKQGEALIKLARKTISDELGIKPGPDIEALPSSLLEDKRFQRRSGTFVTLKIHDQLRGCIGNLDASEPITEGVRRNAINAAFNDYRFSPLTAKEFDKVEIEISILSEPKPLEYIDSSDLINKLRPNVDGVIIRKGRASATFLPQVWEQLSSPEEFLSHLCAKAGLSSDSWKKSKLEVLTYNVQYFEEAK